MATMGNLNRPTTGMMGTAPALPSIRKPISAPAPDLPPEPVSRPTNGVSAAVPLPDGMTTGGNTPPTRAMPNTGGNTPPVPVNQPMPPVSTPTPPTKVAIPQRPSAPPGLANGLYRNSQQMRQQPPMPTTPNSPTPDAGRNAMDGTTSGVAQPVQLPPGMTYQQRPVSATGMPSQPPGPVGRPAGGLFSQLTRAVR